MALLLTQRLTQAVLILLGVAVITFLLLHFLPAGAKFRLAPARFFKRCSLTLQFLLGSF